MAVMSHANWIADTKRSMKPRSKELKAIDNALDTYHKNGAKRTDLVLLQTALNAWIQDKGAGWKTSIRNSNGTVETLQQQITQILGVAVVPKGVALPSLATVKQARSGLKAPAPVRAATTSLATASVVTAYCTAIKTDVHTPWATLTDAERATAMHKALADQFPGINVPQPLMKLVGDLGGAAGQFDFTKWTLLVASGPFGAAAQPSKDEFVDAAKTVYHEGRHCEQWFHMARYAASGEKQTAQELANLLGIPLNIAQQALTRKMDARDPMFRDAKAWFESVYSRSGRAITLTALGLKSIGDPMMMANMRSANHDRYASGLPEEADAWGTEALLDAAYVWP